MNEQLDKRLSNCCGATDIYDGNYEPGNVKWSTRKEQMNNMRRNKNYGRRTSPAMQGSV